MENKKKRTKGHNADRAIAKAGSSTPEKLKTDEPLSEKDEVKKAEENQRRDLRKTTSRFQGLFIS